MIITMRLNKAETAANVRTTAVLKFIRDYMAENQYAPSVREIADSQGFKSTNSVHYHVKKLVEAGRIERPKGSARTILIK